MIKNRTLSKSSKPGSLLLVGFCIMLAVCLALPLGAQAADKLIVKDSGGTNNVFTVRDSGYIVGVASAGVQKSQLHFSRTGTDVGGWITSALDNNFFLSSGAAYDGPAGGWIQKSPDNKSVIAGSGGTGYTIYLQSGATVGSVTTIIPRFKIAYDGKVGIGTTSPAYLLDVAGQARINGIVYGSSKELKDNISDLNSSDALKTLSGLNPVIFTYKADGTEKHVGFIAEDVPDLVAKNGRTGIDPMDIIAVLTKVVQEQQKTIEELNQKMVELEKEVKLKNGFALLEK